MDVSIETSMSYVIQTVWAVEHKLKPFGIFTFNETVRRHIIETTMSIGYKTPNGLSLK